MLTTDNLRIDWLDYVNYAVSYTIHENKTTFTTFAFLEVAKDDKVYIFLRQAIWCQTSADLFDPMVGRTLAALRLQKSIELWKSKGFHELKTFGTRHFGSVHVFDHEAYKSAFRIEPETFRVNPCLQDVLLNSIDKRRKGIQSPVYTSYPYKNMNEKLKSFYMDIGLEIHKLAAFYSMQKPSFSFHDLFNAMYGGPNDMREFRAQKEYAESRFDEKMHKEFTSNKRTIHTLAEKYIFS